MTEDEKMLEKITVKGLEIRYDRINQNGCISLTDIAKLKSTEPGKIIDNRIRSRVTGSSDVPVGRSEGRRARIGR